MVGNFENENENPFVNFDFDLELWTPTNGLSKTSAYIVENQSENFIVMNVYTIYPIYFTMDPYTF